MRGRKALATSVILSYWTLTHLSRLWQQHSNGQRDTSSKFSAVLAESCFLALRTMVLTCRSGRTVWLKLSMNSNRPTPKPQRSSQTSRKCSNEFRTVFTPWSRHAVRTLGEIVTSSEGVRTATWRAIFYYRLRLEQ